MIAGVCVSSAVVIISFLEFYSWFFNNELPAYMRQGLAESGNADIRQHFYAAARDACHIYHPQTSEACESYQLGLLNIGPYSRPLATAAAALMAAMTPAIDFMAALKFSMIALAIGGGILAGLFFAVLMQQLPRFALTAFVLTLVGGWIGTRLLHVAPLNIPLLIGIGISLVAGIVFGARVIANLQKAAISQIDAQSSAGAMLKVGVQIAGIAACFATGYLVHQLFEGRYPVLYLLAALGLWPVLHRALPKLGLLTAGLLAGAIYVATAAMPFLYEVYLPKGQQLCVAGIMITIAVCRDDTRVYWALPLILLFDLQNAAQVCALIVVAEGLTAIGRCKSPTAVVPAAITALIATVALWFTAFYAFKDTFFNISATAALFAMPSVLGSMVAAAVLMLAAWDHRRDVANQVALDRLFMYAASVVAMAGLSLVSYGELAVGALFRGVAPAPVLAIVGGTAAMLVHSHRSADRDFITTPAGPSAAVALATILLLMSSIRGRPISVTQLAEGARAAFTTHFPGEWLRRTPRMSLNDDIVYFDAQNLMTSPLMQYSVIKTILRARISKRVPEIAVFGGRR